MFNGPWKLFLAPPIEQPYSSEFLTRNILGPVPFGVVQVEILYCRMKTTGIRDMSGIFSKIYTSCHDVCLAAANTILPGMN